MSLRKKGSSYTEGSILQCAGPARGVTLCGRAPRASLGQVTPKTARVKPKQHHYQVGIQVIPPR